MNVMVSPLIPSAAARGDPLDVFDRDTEWSDLADFALSPLPELRIAVAYGRRRQGKVVPAAPVSPRRFGDSLAAWAGLSTGAFGFSGWEQAL